MYISDATLHCINEAAIEYNVSARLIISVLQVEQGRTGHTSKNQNGTYDIGLMQINSSWVPLLISKGIKENDIKYNPCINIKVGTWLLAKSIASGNSMSLGIG